MKTETRKLEDLTIHPALKSQPRLSDDELLAWRQGMKRRGEAATPPIYITDDNQIVDGRHRFWCARKLGWTTIPVQIVDASEVYAVIFETLANRRHYTKGQLAYVVAPMLDDVFAEARAREHFFLKKGNVSRSALDAQRVEKGSPKGLETPESAAASLGISARVLQQAREVHALFEMDQAKRTLTDREGVEVQNVTFREFFEPRIMLVEDPEAPRTRPYSLGGVLAGIKAMLKMAEKDVPHGGGRPASVQKQLDLFESSLSAFTAKFDYWKKWEPETRLAAVAELPPVVEKMPDELLHEFAKVVSKEMKRRDVGGAK